MDFSKPVNSSTKIIDISTDNITTVIPLPDNIPRLSGGVLLISDGVMHMVPGARADSWYITNANGNTSSNTAYKSNLTNKVWSFDLKSQKWGVGVSKIQDLAQGSAVAFNAEKQVGWYYGGFDIPEQIAGKKQSLNESTKALQDLHFLDKGKETPIKIETDSSIVGSVENGELVYIEGVGEAGILVLLGGNAGTESTQLVSIIDQIIEPCHSRCLLD